MTSHSTQLLVLGGGATGLGIAWDASLRGLRVLVVEQGDIGQGTSGRYHGLLHSGGRYVLSDPPSARDCAAENLVLRRIAPHTIEDTGGLFVNTPSDPEDYPDRWAAACRAAGVACQEISPDQATRREAQLTPYARRVFAVNDASLDSFDLLHALVHAIRSHGGTIWLRHRVESLQREGDRVVGASIRSLRTGETHSVSAEVVVNATGPWARSVAALAGLDLPIALGKGAMLAMAVRPLHTVLNRLKPPADGDIIVPVGTVAVLGTTDVPIPSPDQLDIEPWEVDRLLTEAEALLPGISSQRALRAWAGVRPLYRPPATGGDETRHLPRAHLIIDHADEHGLGGLVSVIGGKLTTFRLMAEQAIDRIIPKLGSTARCRSQSTPLEPPPPRATYALPSRLARLEHRTPGSGPPQVVCECETITRPEIERALGNAETAELDDIRRDLRLGMGPCQGGFCAYRAASLAVASRGAAASGWLPAFLDERWRGLRPVAWGANLRQMELMRRIYLELLGPASPMQAERP
jgi:glycerol-3-phosphate dehydrogenase